MSIKNNDDYWLKELAEKLDKTAVQPMRSSLFDQINDIMNGGAKSKFSTVNEVVEDMQARSGFIMSKTSDEDEVTVKKTTAGHFLNNYPAIINTIKNIIESSRGLLPVPAIIDKAKRLHEQDVNNNVFFNDDRLQSFVSQQNLKEKGMHSSPENIDNLGKVERFVDESNEPWNTDGFFGIDA